MTDIIETLLPKGQRVLRVAEASLQEPVLKTSQVVTLLKERGELGATYNVLRTGFRISVKHSRVKSGPDSSRGDSIAALPVGKRKRWKERERERERERRERERQGEGLCDVQACGYCPVVTNCMAGVYMCTSVNNRKRLLLAPHQARSLVAYVRVYNCTCI